MPTLPIRDTHSETKAALLSKTDHEKSMGETPHLVDFLRASPLYGVNLDLQRDPSFDRDSD
ncbi:MAG TPA: prevent-host-death family protein [Gammaproteobacteria bacterium]|nr:prevent-host-death family protein [Gammaproteobacteria bacterium]